MNEIRKNEIPEELRQTLLCWYPFQTDAEVLLISPDPTPLEHMFHGAVRGVSVALPDEFLKEEYRQKQFFYVIVLDCLEKISDQDSFLNKVRRLLSPDGIFLLGFRNRFGLKYLSGSLDEWVETPFAGLRNSIPDTHLFTGNEMCGMLKKNGFPAIRMYYPMPDEKFVQAVYSDEYLPEGPITDRIIPFDPFNSPFIAAEGDLYNDIVREKMLPQLADYYLAECRAQEEEGPDPHVIFAALSADRGKEHGFATLLFSDGTAEKKALCKEGIPALQTAYENLEEIRQRGVCTVEQKWQNDTIQMPLIREKTMMTWLKEQIRSDPEAFLQTFWEFYEDVLHSSEESAELPGDMAEKWGAPAEVLRPVLKKAYIDMIPLNSFRAGKMIRYYDQEFAVQNCPARYVLFRALFYTWLHIPEAEEVLPLEEVKTRFGLADLWNGFQVREDRFVSENRNWEKYQQIYEWSWIDRRKLEERSRRLLGNEIDLQLRAVHRVQLGILRRLDMICRQNNIRYMAIHGTLLGAVRHGGFIPWDDDVDLAMPREDYDRFLKVAPGELGEDFFLQTPESDLSCFYGGYCKVRDERTAALELQNRGKRCHQGIWVDIFPLDRCPRDEKKRQKLQKKITLRQRVLFAKLYPLANTMIHDVSGSQISFYYIVCRTVRRMTLIRKIGELCTSCHETGLRAILACYYGDWENRNVYKESECFEVAELPFEDMKICVPANYREWLIRRYGENFMDLPPSEKRTRRKRVRFYTETSYRDLI